MGKFFQIINEKVVPTNLIKFKQSKNAAGEKIEQKKSTIKADHKLNIRNNKLLVFVPKKPIKDKQHGNLCYSVKPNNVPFVQMWINCPLWGKLDGKWEKYSGIREYWKKFKKDLPSNNYIISFVEEKQEENTKNISGE